MHDPRIDRLAEILLDHSCRIEPGEKLLIEAIDLPEPTLVCRLVEMAAQRGAHPVRYLEEQRRAAVALRSAEAEAMPLAGEFRTGRMEEMDAYIGIRGAANSSQFADVPLEKMDLYQQHWWHPVHTEVRVPRTKWVVLRYPTDSMAQAADMSSEAFRGFLFRRLHGRLRADGPRPGAAGAAHAGGRPRAAGRPRNRPDVLDPRHGGAALPWRTKHSRRRGVHRAGARQRRTARSASTPRRATRGRCSNGIELEFREGKIVEATCANETEKLNEILDADDGARYIGEWSIGCNNSRPPADARHAVRRKDRRLDPPDARQRLRRMRQRQPQPHPLGPGADPTPEYGGGEIWFDDELLRKDGRFVPEDLQGLNVGLE